MSKKEVLKEINDLINNIEDQENKSSGMIGSIMEAEKKGYIRGLITALQIVNEKM